MESQLTRLAEAFDQNTDIFSESLKLTESMNVIFQRVMNDITDGSVRFVRLEELEYRNGLPYHPPRAIDFRGYIQEYWMCMAFADFATQAKETYYAAHPEARESNGVIVSANSDAPIVFGGS